MKRIYHDDFGNTATITEKYILPYKGAKETQRSFVLSLTADYDNNFLYFLSVYETMREATDKLKELSCNTWKIEQTA